MGNYLDYPIIDVHNEIKSLVTDKVNLNEPLDPKDSLSSCMISMQGYRNTQEDTGILAEKHVLQDNHLKCNFCVSAIFDGHSGKACSEYLKRVFFGEIVDTTAMKKCEFLSETHLINVFTKIDTEFIGVVCIDQDDVVKNGDKSVNLWELSAKSKRYPRDYSGSCANCVFILPISSNSTEDVYDIVCANVGDSRCVVFERVGLIEVMSTDHKATYELEMKRVEKMGGYVSNGRVNDTLAITRSFGYISYKNDKTRPFLQQAVICIPDVKTKRVTLKKGDRVVVLNACDGVWDVTENNSCCEFINLRLDQQKNGDYYKKRIVNMMNLKDRFNKLLNQGDDPKDFEKYFETKKPNSDTCDYDLYSILVDLAYDCLLVDDHKKDISKDNITVSMTVLSKT